MRDARLPSLLSRGYAVHRKQAGGLKKMCSRDRLKNPILLALLAFGLACTIGGGQAFAERLVFERDLMGTSVEVIVWGPEGGGLEKAVERAYAEIERQTKIPNRSHVEANFIPFRANASTC